MKNTTGQILSMAYKKLRAKKINSALLDAELLLSFVLKKPRASILAHLEIKPTAKQVEKFNALIKQRVKNMPVAYLTKEKYFYGRKFFVDERVLVPRPETEIIIDELKANNYDLEAATKIIDIGTGSGCIIITLAKELKKYHNLKFLAIDISQDALNVARKNAKSHDVAKKIKFIRGSLFSPILSLPRKNAAKNFSNIIITANLPYLTPTEVKKSPSIKHEPKLALLAGKDGLKYYLKLAKQIREFNARNPNSSLSLICEVGETHGKEMKKIFYFAKSVKIITDLAGQNRIFIAKF